MSSGYAYSFHASTTRTISTNIVELTESCIFLSLVAFVCASLGAGIVI